MNYAPCNKRRRVNVTRLFAAVLSALPVVLLGGCSGNNAPGGPLPAPVFKLLQIPDTNGNGWIPFPATPPAEVLPTKGRIVRFLFTAPAGSVFNVSLRALDGTITPLSLNTGTPPPEDGFYQIVSEDPNQAPPVYTMDMRAPLALADPANFDILVVNHTLRTDMSDSSPMTVSLRRRKIFRVDVQVRGNGHVTSSPAGIQCGRDSSGFPLSPCSSDFPAGVVSLAPGANDLNTTKFIGWSGNCDPTQQVCNLTVDGSAPATAIATFGANGTTQGSTCPKAPMLSGLNWAGPPTCQNNQSGVTGPLCDNQGYYCCLLTSGANSARCGAGKKDFPPDCSQLAPNGVLHQPGGCYTVDAP